VALPEVATASEKEVATGPSLTTTRAVFQSGRTSREEELDEREFSLDNPAADHFMLRKAFRDLDRRKLNRVCAEDLVAKMKDAGQQCEVKPEELRTAFKAINSAMNGGRIDVPVIPYPNRSSWSGEKDMQVDELTFEGFWVMILQHDIEQVVGQEPATLIHEVREFYVRFTTEQTIIDRTRVNRAVLDKSIKDSKIPRWLEPSIGLVILVNACTIGISQDFAQESALWTIVECTCTFVFVIELCIKLRCVGACEHFFGLGWAWNWFDFAIIIIGVMDVCFLLLDLMHIQGLPSFGGITIVRLVRLLRIARLVRLLRMRFFKELTLIVNGVLTGLKTLCWAFVFLAVLVYILGVLMKQLLDPASFARACADSQDDPSCTHSEAFLLDSNGLLFSTVFRSMFTVFRCLIGDCAGPDGVPLAPHLMDSLGNMFTLGYLVVMCFVLFGVFNLVMAIFVENTLEAARVSQQKRHQARKTEDIRVAQELREIVLRICTRRPDSQAQEEEMQMAVTREVFEEVMQDPKVMRILEDLEISVMDHAKLFDIIDSNGSGQLDIPEIIEGLMKLRGPADKGDVVCAALMVRSVQRELKRLEGELMMRHKALLENQVQTLFALENTKKPNVQAVTHIRASV